MKRNEILKENAQTPYQKIAADCGVSAKFVGMIARGERVPKRGKGAEVLEQIKKLTGN